MKIRMQNMRTGATFEVDADNETALNDYMFQTFKVKYECLAFFPIAFDSKDARPVFRIETSYKSFPVSFWR